MTRTWYTEVATDLGTVLLTGDGDAVTGLYWTEHRRGPSVGTDWRRDAAPFTAVVAELEAYLSGEGRAFTAPTAPTGSAFQRAVWDRLGTIPYGSTTTYGRIAADLGRPAAVRAVAGAVARNPISVLVPCHRVVGANGTLTGYAGGVERKRWLLDLESGQRSGLSAPTAAAAVSSLQAP
jgi:methylated-DNA-[protein]-cysteine S-methyltransferase